MPKSKKNRDSTTTPRGSQYIEGQLIHTATNQKLFFQTHVCTVFREILKENADFSRFDSLKIMDKNLKKRQAHGTGNILEDRLTFEKEKGGKDPFRSFVFYREIVDVQRSKTKPEYFVLSIDSESGTKYYEVYKCKTKEDAHKMETFIKQAMEDEQKMVRDGPVLDVVTVKDNPDMRRSASHIEFQTSLESIDENCRASTIYQVTSPTPPDGFEVDEPPVPAHYSPIMSPVIQPQTLVAAAAPSPPRQRTPSPIPQKRYHSMDGLNDVTYITYEPRTRTAVVSDDGPIYMYFMRKRNLYDNSSFRGSKSASLGYNSVLHNDRESTYQRW